MNDIHPINNVINTPWLSDQLLFIIWIIASLGLSFLTAWLIYLYFFYNKPLVIPALEIKPEKKDIDYKKEALCQLEELYLVIDKTETKIVCLALTSILKSFLSQIENLNLTDLTTTEVMIILSNLEKINQKELALILTTMDLAKFADINLDIDGLKEVYQEIYNFIKKYEIIDNYPQPLIKS